LLAITVREIMDKIVIIAVQISRFLFIYTNVHTHNANECNVIILTIILHRWHIWSCKWFIFCL